MLTCEPRRTFATYRYYREKNLVQTGAVGDPFWRGPTDPLTRWALQTPL